MKRSILLPAIAIVTLLMTLTGCQAIADIFKAGVWTGIIIIVFVIVVIVILIGRASKK